MIKRGLVTCLPKTGPGIRLDYRLKKEDRRKTLQARQEYNHKVRELDLIEISDIIFSKLSDW